MCLTRSWTCLCPIGLPVNQYMTSRCTKHPNAIVVLEARAINSFFNDIVRHHGVGYQGRGRDVVGAPVP
jgi:hypothetical protein